MKTVVLPILCLLAFAASAQDLLHSRQSSAFTYIFRISNKEAARIYVRIPGKQTPLICIRWWILSTPTACRCSICRKATT